MEDFFDAEEPHQKKKEMKKFILFWGFFPPIFATFNPKGKQGIAKVCAYFGEINRFF